MEHDVENPFSVTKATEFSDIEINEYWVNFNPEKDTSIESILNPQEFLPKYVIGGKGCGKTHILRYFSYPLQKIRNNGDIRKVLSEDKYIGLYSVFHGLNSSRFEGKNISEAEWSAIFEYYFELYISDNLLRTFCECFSNLNLTTEVELKLTETIIKQFNNYSDISHIRKLNDLVEYLITLRRKIDFQISNAAFTRKLNYDDVKVVFSPGDLIFGIPVAISGVVGDFKEIKFIYIFDEYEKLFEWQKKYINTLVWDKKNPVTFWIGARRYGYTTRDTKSGEPMKPGSEFSEVNLDFIIRNNESLYKEFAKQLYINRLVRYYQSKGAHMKPEAVHNSFCNRFEKYDESSLINQIIEKNKKKEYKHIKEFKRKVVSFMKGDKPPEKEHEADLLAQTLVSMTDNNPLEQKYKLFYFYQLWYQAKNKEPLTSIADKVNLEYKKAIETKSEIFEEIKDKRKKDFIAQLTKENSIKNAEYTGVEKFIDLSQGNARTFILILKKIIEYAKIRGERPLEDGGKISLDTQYLAIYDTARWFYEDAELIGDKGKHLYNSLKCLADYLMLFRFCDKPTETTVSSFYVKTEELSISANDCIDLMNSHSIIIEHSGRFEKNSGRKEKQFQLNRILAPLWNLPSVVRGTIYLNKDVAEAVFDYNKNSNFEKLYLERKSSLNAPDFLKFEEPKTTGKDLFDQE